MDEHRRKREAAERSMEATKIYAGRALCVIALAFCVPVGIFFVSVATGAVGIVLGVTGYALGARTLGRLAAGLCTAAMLLGLLVGQGAMPGSYDAMVDGVRDALQHPIYPE